MRRPKGTGREAPNRLRFFVNPFSWADAVLKSGDAMLASMQAAAARAKAVNVGTVPFADAAPPATKRARKPARKAAPARPKAKRKPQASRQVVRRKSRRSARS